MDNPVVVIILRAVIAIVAATFGGLFAMGSERVSHRTLCALVSFAAGALLAVTLQNIVPETLELVGWKVGLATLAIGLIAFGIIGKYVYVVCPACAVSAEEHEGGYLGLGYLMVIAMAIHSTVDGLAISAGSAASSSGHGLSSLGILILLAVSYHKIPEGMALVSVARLAGNSRRKALLITVLVELTTAMGAFIGLIFLHGLSRTLLGITLGIVAGSFIYTVGFALLKEMYVHERHSILLYAAAGLVTMIVISGLITKRGPAALMH